MGTWISVKMPFSLVKYTDTVNKIVEPSVTLKSTTAIKLSKKYPNIEGNLFIVTYFATDRKKNHLVPWIRRE